MVIFRFLSENCLKLELSIFVVHEMPVENKEEDTKGIFQEKINHNLNFSKTEAINMKELASFFSRYNPFPSWLFAAQDTYV